jgi:hypothetical protein
MEQPIPQQVAHNKRTQPRRRDIFFHAIKTSRLIGALTKDRRISVVRKVVFFGLILLLLAILLFPDALEELGLSFALPILGTVLGLPIDAGFDWMAFALAVIALFRLFPAEIVSEHYQRLFA